MALKRCALKAPLRIDSKEKFMNHRKLIAAASLALSAVFALPAVAQVDTSRLIGKWQRSDGGYVIDIRAAKIDGKLEAAYFNPNPINVSQANWQLADKAGLEVFVELRDKGYPGATYKLLYQPGNDSLVGSYTQPAAKQTFDVVFSRQR
jgi:hypothetical protein